MIVLYNPQSSRCRRPVIPFSLLSLGTLLEGCYQYAIVDGNLSRDPTAEICDRLGSGGILGVSAMPGPQITDALRVSREVRKRIRDVVIVWGGYFATQHPDVCLREPTIDYIVRGYGEHSFLKLVEQSKDGRTDPNGIPGLCYRRSDGRSTKQPLQIKNNATVSLEVRFDERNMMLQNNRAAPPDPNMLPDFPYHRIDMAAYTRPTYLGRRTLGHHSSVGCPFTCNYCAVTGLARGKYRTEAPQRTARVVERLVHEFGADSLQFYDNNFFVDEARTAEICERITPLQIGWWAEGRMDTLLGWNDRTWQLMADSGLRMIFMGAEAATDDRLRRMHRGGTASPGDALDMATKCRRYGIIPEFSFVMGSPPDPAEDIDATFTFVCRIKRVNSDSEIILYLYTPVPVQGDLLGAALQQGFRFPDTLDEWASDKWVSFIQRRSHLMPWLPRGVHARLRGFELTLNAYYPTRTDPRLTNWRRAVLRAFGAWRYYMRFYRFPLELRLVQRCFRYQRPETTGF